MGDVLTTKRNATARRLIKAHNSATKGRFTAARLTDDTEGLAFFNCKRDITYGVNSSHLSLKNATVDGEFDGQVTYVQKCI